VSALGTVLRPVFQVEPKDLPAPTKGEDPAAQRLQQVVYTVTECVELTLRTPNRTRLVAALDAYPEEVRGFAYEGAGVALAALDHLAPWSRRTRDFVRGPAEPYRYAVYLGAGMGLARIHRGTDRFVRRLGNDPFGWVVLDGYGFHEGFFAHRRTVQEQRLPAWLNGYAVRAFDHGLGRSIWFATGADPELIGRTIGAFPHPRRGDLWAGIGLACGYTGGTDAAAVQQVRLLAAGFEDRLAEGAMVAAKNRHEVGNPAAHNDIATTVLCSLSSREAARRAEAALIDLPDDDVVPAYEVWRGRLRAAGTAGFGHTETILEEAR
jgi:hypothetical protein